MANKKVSDLTAITSTEGDDLIYIVDTSDTSGGSAGTSKKIKVQDFRTFSIKNASFVSTNAEMALTMASSTNDSTTFSYTNIFIIPEKCRLVSIQSASQVSGGSTDFAAYKPAAMNATVAGTTELGSVNVASHTAGTTHTATFDTSTYDYDKGDLFGITVDSTNIMYAFTYTITFRPI